MDPGTVKGKLTIVNRLGKVEGDELGLGTWIPPMETYPILDEVGIILACTTLISSLRKGIHSEHLQWESMRKGKRLAKMYMG